MVAKVTKMQYANKNIAYGEPTHRSLLECRDCGYEWWVSYLFISGRDVEVCPICGLHSCKSKEVERLPSRLSA